MKIDAKKIGNDRPSPVGEPCMSRAAVNWEVAKATAIQIDNLELRGEPTLAYDRAFCYFIH